MTWVSVVWTSSRHMPDAGQLLRVEVSRLCGVASDSVRLTRMCPMCGSGGHGRPSVVPWSRLAPPSVSLSRSPGLSAVVVASKGAAGIDVDDVDSFADHRLSAVLLHERERADVPVDLATTWVRKEALLKAAGCGLSVDPRRVRLTGPREAPAVLEWPAGTWAAEPTWILDLDLAPEVRAAVAGSGRVPEVVMVRQVGAEGSPG
jgi:4'-phosphopantetheinyl transferase